MHFRMMNNTTCQEYQSPAAAMVGSASPAHTTPTTIKKSSRRIRFAPAVTVQPIDCTLSPEEHSRSHYSKDEMDAFSLDVKKAVSRTPSTQSACCIVHACEGDCLVGLEADPALRGIAHYLCPNRVRNKYLVRKALLKYQRSLNAVQHPSSGKTNVEKLHSLASASAKLSHWSRMVAMETARLDSLRAYDVDYMIPIGQPVVVTQFPISITAKRVRRVTCEDEEVDSQPQAKQRRL